jgi:hypothetical protein
MATKEDVKLEKEYQEALNISSSALSGMQKNIQNILDTKKNLNSETKKYLNDLKSTVSELTDSESINKQILKNQEEIQKFKNGEYKVSKAAADTSIKALEVQNASLGVYGKQQEAIERVKQKADEVSDKLGGWVDKISASARQIPGIGGLLSGFADKAGAKLKAAFGTANQKYVAAYGNSLKSGAGHLKSMASGASAAGGTMLKAFMGPQAILLLLIGALVAGFWAIKQFEAGMKAFRQETGLVKGQMDGIESTAAGIGAATMHLTGDVAEGAKVVGQMVAGFGSIERLSNATLMNAAKLSLSYGIGAEHIAATNKLFQNMNGLTEEQAQYMTTNVAKMAEINDVSPQNVLKDMNESSAEMYKYFKGSPVELMKSAIQAQKLGTSLKQSAEVSKGLLNFEDSINSELEASALLGKNLNFNQARYLAATGDTVGAQQAVMKEVAKLGDLTKLNVFEQEALAKAANMPLEDLLNQQRVKEKMVELSAHDKYLQEQLIKKGIDITTMSQDRAKAALEEQAIANRNVESTEIMENNMKAMLLNLASAFSPLAIDLMNFLNKNMPEIQAFIHGTAAVIGSFVDGVQVAFAVVNDALQPVKDVFNELFPEDSGIGFVDILQTVAKILGGTLLVGITETLKKFSAVVEMGRGLWDLIQGIWNMDFTQIGDGLMQMFSGLVDFIFALPETIIDIFASIFPNVTFFQDMKLAHYAIVEDIKNFPMLIWESLKSIGSSIYEWFYSIVPDWAKEFFGIEAPSGGGKSLDEIWEGTATAGAIKTIDAGQTAAALAQKEAEKAAVNGTKDVAKGITPGATQTINSTPTPTTGNFGSTGYTSGTSFGLGSPVTISAESFKGTTLNVNDTALAQSVSTNAEATKYSGNAVASAVSTLGGVTTEKMSETTKKMVDKLEEIRKAVILGTLIEMDGTILTQTVTQRQEAFNRVNFASRLKS